MPSYRNVRRCLLAIVVGMTGASLAAQSPTVRPMVITIITEGAAVAPSR